MFSQRSVLTAGPKLQLGKLDGELRVWLKLASGWCPHRLPYRVRELVALSTRVYPDMQRTGICNFRVRAYILFL